MKVLTGHDQLLTSHLDLLRGRRVGLLVNPTSVGADLIHLVDRVAGTPNVTLAALYGPEHGVRGGEQDMIAVDGSREPGLDVPVYSLYGADEASLRPSADLFSDIDVLVYDIQDIGSRYYTYVYTLLLAMETAAEARVDVVVLDRPNPIGGTAVEGNLVHEGFASFVGLHPLANRHGMTAGELAGMFREERQIDVELTVVPLQGWTRDMHFEDTGLPWVMPSPNMPTVETTIVYPGMCMIEGTTLSEGRGTTHPFELFGAPWLDGDALAAALNAEDLPGAGFRSTTFKPTFQKHAGTTCGGVQIHVSDRRQFLPLRTGLAALVHARRLGGHAFEWRNEVYEFVADRLAIDLLLGDASVREAIEAGATVRDLEILMSQDHAAFRTRREAFLAYTGAGDVGA